MENSDKVSKWFWETCGMNCGHHKVIDVEVVRGPYPTDNFDISETSLDELLEIGKGIIGIVMSIKKVFPF